MLIMLNYLNTYKYVSIFVSSIKNKKSSEAKKKSSNRRGDKKWKKKKNT